MNGSLPRVVSVSESRLAVLPYHGGPGSPDVVAEIADVHLECKRT